MSVTTARRTTGRLLYAVVLATALLVAGFFLLPKALGYDVYVITTGSMEGTVDPGGLVIADRVPVAELAVGDVITYSPPAGSGVSHLVTHRITEIGRDAAGAVVYRTKGDANAHVDPWTFRLERPVQARMQWAVPSVGWPVLWLADPDARRLAIGVPAAAIALLALKDLVVALLPARRREDPTVIDLVAPDGRTPHVVDLTDAQGALAPAR